MTVPSTLFSRRTVLGAAASLAALSALPAGAALRVDITGVGANQIPVAITVNQPADAPQDIGAIVRSDLERSGSFRFVDASQLGPVDDYEKPSILPEVAKLDVNAFVAAKVEALGDGRWDVHYYLYDAVSGEALDSARFTGRPTTLRMSAHRISDRLAACLRRTARAAPLSTDRGRFGRGKSAGGARVARTDHFARLESRRQVARLREL